MKPVLERSEGMEKLLNIDRRFIFLLVSLAVIAPLLIEFDLPIHATSSVKGVFDTIESLPEGSTVLLSLDYGPSTKEELYPMVLALLRHCFERNVKPIGLTLEVTGADLGQRAFETVAEEYKKENGKDWVFLGYKSGWSMVVIGMGENLKKTFSQDAYGKNTAELPALDGVDSLRDIDYAVDLASGGSIEMWIAYGKDKYKFDFGAGCTAVIGPDMYPFLQSKQINGLLGGLVGAAEYEELVKHRGQASKGMRPQSVVHTLVVLFVILGNIIYFLVGRKSEAQPSS